MLRFTGRSGRSDYEVEGRRRSSLTAWGSRVFTQQHLDVDSTRVCIHVHSGKHVRIHLRTTGRPIREILRTTYMSGGKWCIDIPSNFLSHNDSYKTQHVLYPSSWCFSSDAEAPLFSLSLIITRISRWNPSDSLFYSIIVRQNVLQTCEY